MRSEDNKLSAMYSCNKVNKMQTKCKNKVFCIYCVYCTLLHFMLFLFSMLLLTRYSVDF